MDYKLKSVLVDAAGFNRTITRLAHEIIERNRGTANLGFVGMQTRGVYLARRLALKIEEIESIKLPVGVLDTTMYRDDYRTALKQPKVQTTEISFDLYNMNVVLVDDVLYTGRTVRAALDALMDIGRPKRIQLAVLVDRGHRELPIKPDFVGRNVPTSMNEEVRVQMSEVDDEDSILLVEVPTSMSLLAHKHMLGLADYSEHDITMILDTAVRMKDILDRPVKKVPTLRGVTVVNLFFEASTRTRISFELAEKRLSADTLNFSASGSSLSKGETLLDTALNIEAMKIDVVVMRHKSPGSPHFLSRHLDSVIINAGDGTHEHPTQALLDMLTLRERFGTLKGLRVCLVGDISHSRVALSNIIGLRTMGAKVTLCGPATLIPREVERFGVDITHSLDEAIQNCDALNILRIQLERQTAGLFPSLREYQKYFGLTRDRLSKASTPLTILHPGPMNRGVEITSDVADSEHSVILQQVTNGVAVRMAVLYLLAGAQPQPA